MGSKSTTFQLTDAAMMAVSTVHAIRLAAEDSSVALQNIFNAIPSLAARHNKV